MEYEKAVEFCDKQIEQIKKQCMITEIDLSLYKTYLKFYSDTINSKEEEELILRYIHDMVVEVIYDEEYNDREFMDYYDAFISGQPYGYEIISPQAVAEFLHRRLNMLKFVLDEGKSYEDARKSILDEKYETNELLTACLTTKFSEWNVLIFHYANLFAKQHIDYISEETGLPADQLDGLINTITSPFDQDFNAALVAPQSLIVNETDDGLMLAVPNLVLVVIDLIKQITSETPVQNNLIMVNQYEED